MQSGVCNARKLETHRVLTEALDELEIVNAQETKLPFEVHGAHHAFVCGGYAACVKCAFTAACGTKANKLVQECKGVHTKHGGSIDRVKRILRGDCPAAMRRVGQMAQ